MKRKDINQKNMKIKYENKEFFVEFQDKERININLEFNAAAFFQKVLDSNATSVILSNDEVTIKEFEKLEEDSFEKKFIDSLVNSSNEINNV